MGALSLGGGRLLLYGLVQIFTDVYGANGDY